MPSPADRHRPGPRRAAAVGLALGVLVLAGCGGAWEDRVPGLDTGATAATPAPAETAAPPGAAPAPADAPADAPGSVPGGASGSGVPDVPLLGTTLADIAASSTSVPPVSLELPALDITVPVDPVGVQPDGQMEIPPLAERAGWYRYGSSPGDADGTAVIAAHVDSVASAGLGPFADLPDAEVGDPVDVTLADGSVRRYEVTTVERVAKPEIAWSDVFVRDGGPRLVLVTCGGTFQRDVGSYTDNVIVTAQPVGG